MSRFDDLTVNDGDPVPAGAMADALTAAPLVFGDGATQVFATDGTTTYVESGRQTSGEWWVLEDGKFSSFWPPSYRAVYSISWIADHGAPIGLTFVQQHGGGRFDGRYQ